MNLFNPGSLIVEQRHQFILVILAGVTTWFFSSFNQNSFFRHATFGQQGELAYNVARHNALTINPLRQAYIYTQSAEQHRAVDYAEIDHESFGPPSTSFGCNDTFGYGLLIGLIWKITRSLKYRDIQLIQLLMFSLLMPLLYEIFFMLSDNRQTALWGSIALLGFQPLLFLNAQLLSDIWAYYGNVVLVWVMIRYFTRGLRLPWVFCGGSFFAMCQLIRATALFSLILLSLVILYLAWRQKTFIKNCLLIAMLGVSNIVFFWIPFCTHNYVVHQQLFVSCTGHDLLAGLGEFNNPWNYIMDDGFCDQLVQKRHGISAGTPAYNQKAQAMFWECVTEHPLFYISTIIRRLPRIFSFNPLWNSNTNSLFKNTQSRWSLVIAGLHSPFAMLMKLLDYAVARLRYVELYLLIAWLGVLVALLRRQWLSLLIASALIIASLSKIPSHLEQRYQIPFYWIMALFIGHLASAIYAYRVKKHNHALLKKSARLL